MYGTCRHCKKQNQGYAVPDCSLLFDEASQALRWFLLPSEAKIVMATFKKYGPPIRDRLNIKRLERTIILP